MEIMCFWSNLQEHSAEHQVVKVLRGDGGAERGPGRDVRLELHQHQGLLLLKGQHTLPGRARI